MCVCTCMHCIRGSCLLGLSFSLSLSLGIFLFGNFPLYFNFRVNIFCFVFFQLSIFLSTALSVYRAIEFSFSSWVFFAHGSDIICTQWSVVVFLLFIFQCETVNISPLIPLLSLAAENRKLCVYLCNMWFGYLIFKTYKNVSKQNDFSPSSAVNTVPLWHRRLSNSFSMTHSNPWDYFEKKNQISIYFEKWQIK